MTIWKTFLVRKSLTDNVFYVHWFYDILCYFTQIFLAASLWVHSPTRAHFSWRKMAAVHDRELPAGWLMEKSLWRGVAIYWLALAMRKAPKKAIVLQMAIVDAWITWILIASSSFSRPGAHALNDETHQQSRNQFKGSRMPPMWSTNGLRYYAWFSTISWGSQEFIKAAWCFGCFFFKVFQSVGFLIIINHPNWRWCFRGVAKNHQPEGNRFTYIYYIIKPHGVGAISMGLLGPSRLSSCHPCGCFVPIF